MAANGGGTVVPPVVGGGLAARRLDRKIGTSRTGLADLKENAARSQELFASFCFPRVVSGVCRAERGREEGKFVYSVRRAKNELDKNTRSPHLFLFPTRSRTCFLSAKPAPSSLLIQL